MVAGLDSSYILKVPQDIIDIYQKFFEEILSETAVGLKECACPYSAQEPWTSRALNRQFQLLYFISIAKFGKTKYSSDAKKKVRIICCWSIWYVSMTAASKLVLSLELMQICTVIQWSSLLQHSWKLRLSSNELGSFFNDLKYILVYLTSRLWAMYYLHWCALVTVLSFFQLVV